MSKLTYQDFKTAAENGELNLKRLMLLHHLAEEKRCIWCSKKFDQILTHHNAGMITQSIIALLSVDFLAHCFQTHGYPPEILEMMLQNMTRETKK